jgi:peptide-methionine (R)-S-oxide reductase
VVFLPIIFCLVMLAGCTAQPPAKTPATVLAKGSEVMKKIVKTEAEWRAQLTPEQYRITRERGTERPFCGLMHESKEPGSYVCICCGLELFNSANKFKSGTGWPSFYQPVAASHIQELEDRSHGMVRTEIRCARCEAHLGHVFDDGPPPTGKRYCLNEVSLKFVPEKK